MKNEVTLSVIIPCLDEERYIEKCLKELTQNQPKQNCEIILVDAGSQDNTLAIAQNFPCQIVQSTKANRGYQMNEGAKVARGKIILFLHADTLVPPTYLSLITDSIRKTEGFGLFAYDFYPSSGFLKVNAWFTRKRWGFTGGGDQALFMVRALFEDIGGYKEELEVMEDFDLFARLKSTGVKWDIIQKPLRVSSRKYQYNGYLKVQLVNAMAVIAFRMGINTSSIRKWYERQLKKG